MSLTLRVFSTIQWASGVIVTHEPHNTFYLASTTFLFFSIYNNNKRLLVYLLFARQKTRGACLYMPQDSHWHWLASFEVIPPSKKGSFSAAKKLKTPHWKLLFLILVLAVGAFSVFSAKILSRRSRLSRTSRAPSRLIWPRPIDCDARPQQTVKTFPVFGFEHRLIVEKISFFKMSGI